MYNCATSLLPREVYFELSSRYDEGNISNVYVDALVVQMARTRPRRRWTDERCDVSKLHRIMHDEAFTPKKKKKKSGPH